MATTLPYSSPPIATFLSSFHSNSKSCFSLKILPSLPSNSHPVIPVKKAIVIHDAFYVISPSSNKLRRIRAVPEDGLASEATATETAQQMLSSGDEGVSTVISVLLFVAFIGLSILTIGVIYLGVTDFLQKREKEKFEKEEAAKKGKKKKKKVRARAGPKGFGQKIDEDEDDG